MEGNFVAQRVEGPVEPPWKSLAKSINQSIITPKKKSYFKVKPFGSKIRSD